MSGERTRPLKFVVTGVELAVVEEEGERPLFAGQFVWDRTDGAFCLDSSMQGNYDFAPCDLEELARIARSIKREP